MRTGQSVSFTCHVQGGNIQGISWFRHKKNESAFHQNIELKGQGGRASAILRLGRVTLSDAGEYECRVADLGVGYLASVAWLTVLGRLWLNYGGDRRGGGVDMTAFIKGKGWGGENTWVRSTGLI